MRSNPRLLFSDEEQTPPEQPAPTPKPKQPPNSTKSTPTPKHENPTTQQRTVQAGNGKKAVRLHFHPSWARVGQILTTYLHRCIALFT
jgi:hypothetical protein